jgi:hypothetical protein
MWRGLKPPIRVGWTAALKRCATQKRNGGAEAQVRAGGRGSEAPHQGGLDRSAEALRHPKATPKNSAIQQGHPTAASKSDTQKRHPKPSLQEQRHPRTRSPNSAISSTRRASWRRFSGGRSLPVRRGLPGSAGRQARHQILFRFRAWGHGTSAAGRRLRLPRL